MSYTGETFKEAIALLLALPDKTYFTIEGDSLIFNGYNQEGVKRIRRILPKGIIWQKRYNEACKWWEYNGETGNLKIKIRACSEVPPTCKAITEIREVEVKTPLTFKTERIKKEVIVGWDCGSE